MGSIACLGLGPSLNLFNPADFEMSIGVNDIWKYFESEAVVCLDKRSAFTAERLLTIDNCKPKAFYSQIVNWDTRPDFHKIELFHHYPNHECILDYPQFNKSYCSPFVACQIAFRYYGAMDIHLFGVDLTNHKHLDRRLCEQIKIHFRNLKGALNVRGCAFVVHGDGILSDI